MQHDKEVIIRQQHLHVYHVLGYHCFVTSRLSDHLLLVVIPAQV